MIIPTLIPPLLAEIEDIFAYPARRGLPAPTSEGLALMDVLEALLPKPQWEWLTADDLMFALRQSEQFQLRDEHVVRTGAALAAPPPNAGASSTARTLEPTPQELFLARPVSEPGSPVPLGAPVRLYATRETAMLIAGARSGTFEDVRFWELRTEAAVARSARLESLGEGTFLGTGLDESMLREVTVDLASPWMDALRYRLKLAETLYLDDPGPQADASRALFELRPQAVVEADLVPHLAREDRFVRINVLTALGLPAYKAGFVPGQPLPAREDRLEPVTLNPATVGAILALAHEERDAGVLSYVLCTLKAQTYAGKLRDIGPRIREVVRRDVLPRVEEPSVIQDAKELLGLLPAMS